MNLNSNLTIPTCGARIILATRKGVIVKAFDLKEALRSEELQTALLSLRLYQGLEALIRKRGEALGLSPSQVQILLFLSYAHPRYRRTTAIAKRFSIAPATACRILNTLERKGLIRRRRHQEDRRGVEIELTAAGRRMVAQLTGIGEQLIAYLDELKAEERHILTDALRKILHSLEESGYLAQVVICRSCPHFRESAYPGTRKPHLCQLTGERLTEEESYLERLDEPVSAGLF